MMLTERERQLVAAVWPVQLLEDPDLAPRLVHTADEFARELLLGDHLEDVVVLPGGTDKLGLSETNALPNWLLSALDCGATAVLDCLHRVEGAALEGHKAALEYVDSWGVQREALPRPYPFCLFDAPMPFNATAAPGALPEAWRDLRQRVAAADALVQRGEVDPKHIYACEMRRLRERDANPSAHAAIAAYSVVGDGSAIANNWGCKTKSLSLRHARDYLDSDARWTLYWNCYDDGLFIGGSGSGKGLHVDQVLWSNVGKHWRGLKLLAVWPAGEISASVVRDMGDTLFLAPLRPQQVAALGQAAKIVLLRPGDVFLCSGGVAHTTVSVSEELTVTAYESLVNLNPRHVAHFLRTGQAHGSGTIDRGVMQAEDRRELFSGVAQHVLSQLRFETAARGRAVTRAQSGAWLPHPARSSTVGVDVVALQELLAGAARALGAHAELTVSDSLLATRLRAAADNLCPLVPSMEGCETPPTKRQRSEPTALCLQMAPVSPASSTASTSPSMAESSNSIRSEC